MAIIQIASRTVTNLPTATAGPGVFAGATTGKFWVREVKVFNTTSTAVCVGVAVCTATGTQVGGLTEYQIDDASAPAPSETAFTSMSSAATVAAQIEQATLGAAAGSGIIFTWGEKELEIPEGTGNGIIINCPTGTAQHLDFSLKWQK
jgi:hypothetical protein